MTDSKKQENLLRKWHLYVQQTWDHNADLGQALKDVVDLFDTVRTGLETDLGREPTETTILEVTKLVLQRWDKVEERRDREEREEWERRNQLEKEG